MDKDINKVVVVGAGIMGHGLAQCFAQAGYQVSLVSRTQKTLDRASMLIESSLNTMAQEGLIEGSQIPAIIGRITTTTSVEEGARDADIALETVVENREAKKEIFAQLDACCPPRTLIASNTTTLNIFELAEISRPDKLLIAHWYVPPELIPLVDVVKGPQTDDANIELVVNVLRKMGKKPIVFKKYTSGYVVSRLQIALQQEIYYLLDNDYLTPEDIDDAAKFGLALRMMVVGVVQRIDFGGLDLSTRSLERPSIKLTPQEYKPKKIFELVNEGHLGVKTGRGFYDYKGRSVAELCHERDIRLIHMLKAVQELKDTSSIK